MGKGKQRICEYEEVGVDQIVDIWGLVDEVFYGDDDGRAE